MVSRRKRNRRKPVNRRRVVLLPRALSASPPIEGSSVSGRSIGGDASLFALRSLRLTPIPPGNTLSRLERRLALFCQALVLTCLLLDLPELLLLLDPELQLFLLPGELPALCLEVVLRARQAALLHATLLRLYLFVPPLLRFTQRLLFL